MSFDYEREYRDFQHIDSALQTGFQPFLEDGFLLIHFQKPYLELHSQFVFEALILDHP